MSSYEIIQFNEDVLRQITFFSFFETLMKMKQNIVKSYQTLPFNMQQINNF